MTGETGAFLRTVAPVDHLLLQSRRYRLDMSPAQWTPELSRAELQARVMIRGPQCSFEVAIRLDPIYQMAECLPLLD